MAVSPQVIVHAANGLNVFCHVYSLSEYKNEPSTLPSMFREPCGFIIHGKRGASHHVIIFQPAERQFDALRPADWLSHECALPADRSYRCCPDGLCARHLHRGRFFLLPPVTPSVETSASRAIHHAADNRNVHRSDYIFRALLQRVNRTDNIKFLTRTGRAGDEVDPARTDTQRFQNIETDFDLFDRIGRQRYAQRVADAFRQQQT